MITVDDVLLWKNCEINLLKGPRVNLEGIYVSKTLPSSILHQLISVPYL